VSVLKFEVLLRERGHEDAVVAFEADLGNPNVEEIVAHAVSAGLIDADKADNVFSARCVPRRTRRSTSTAAGTHARSACPSRTRGDSLTVDGGSCSQGIRCLECGSRWYDVYRLDGYETTDAVVEA